MAVDHKIYFFIYENKQAKAIAVNDLINLPNDKGADKALTVWSTLQSEWVSLARWKLEFLPLVKDYLDYVSSFWDIKIDKLEIKKLKVSEVIETLLDPDLEKVLVRKTTDSEYQPFKEFPVFEKLIQIAKRKAERYALKGIIKIIPLNKKTVLAMGSLVDIGFEGATIKMSMTDFYKKGDAVNVEIDAKEFTRPIVAEGTVLKASKRDKLISIGFDKLDVASSDTLNTYINRIQGLSKRKN